MTEDHLEYILEKQKRTIKKFGIDNLGHSKGEFSDFDEKPIMSKDKTRTIPKPKKKIEKIRKDPNKPTSDRWFPLKRIQD